MNKPRFRDGSGNIVHGPECIAPDKYSPRGICFCDYMHAHEFVDQSLHDDPECHECGLMPDDPVHLRGIIAATIDNACTHDWVDGVCHYCGSPPTPSTKHQP